MGIGLKSKLFFNQYNNRNYSIKWTLFSYFVIFIAIILAILFLFQIVFLDDFYRARKEKEVETTAKVIEKNKLLGSDNLFKRVYENDDTCIIFTEVYENDSKDSYFPEEFPNSAMEIKSNVKNPKFNLVAEVDELKVLKSAIETAKNGGTFNLNINGHVFLDSTKIDNFFQNNFIIRKYNEALENKNGSNLEEVPLRREDDGSSIIYTNYFTAMDGKTYLTMVETSIMPLESTVGTISTQFYIIAILMILVALILAALISRKIVNPIVKINKGAKVLSTGDYDVEFSTSGYSEAVELGESLNYAVRELSKVEALRRELIANVSHDLRTPLTMITGYSEAIRDLPGEDSKENIQVVIDESRRLTDLVNDVLQLSKLQGDTGCEREVYNLTSDILGVVDRYNEMLKIENYEIIFEREGDIYVDADRGKILQVIYNLLNNAVTYTGEDKKVTIKQTVNNSRVRIDIIDSGEGITKEEVPFIWDRYYKSNNNHKRAVAGSGLGLSIVKEILELHSAKYGVISKQNEGSDFWFEMPVSKEEGN